MEAVEEPGVVRELPRVEVVESVQVLPAAVAAVVIHRMEVLGLGVGAELAQALAK
jgi:hypothetical protein